MLYSARISFRVSRIFIGFRWAYIRANVNNTFALSHEVFLKIHRSAKFLSFGTAAVIVKHFDNSLMNGDSKERVI